MANVPCRHNTAHAFETLSFIFRKHVTILFNLSMVVDGRGIFLFAEQEQLAVSVEERQTETTWRRLKQLQ